MKNTLMNGVALIALVLPFVTVAIELLRRESITTVLVFAGIALILATTVIMAVLSSRPRRS